MTENIHPMIRKSCSRKLVAVLIGIVIALAGVCSIIYSGILSNKLQEEKIAFSEIYKSENYNYSGYVYVDIAEEPFEIGHYDDDEQYYYITDGNDIYIMICSKSKYDEISSAIKANGTYNLVGSIAHLSNEVIATAMEIYSGDDTSSDLTATREKFTTYFADIAISANKSATNVELLIILGIFLLAFAIIIILAAGLEYLSYRRTLKKMSDAESEMVYSEMESPQTVFIKKCNTYLTPRYIVSLGNKLEIHKYTDILWAYRFDQSYSFVPVLTNIKAMTSDMKTVNIADMQGLTAGKTQIINQILEQLQAHNPQVAIGYTSEYIKHFKELRKSQHK